MSPQNAQRAAVSRENATARPSAPAPAAAAAPAGSAPSRTGILLVNTGTPDAPSVKTVRKYLSKFLMNRRIRPMNAIFWWIILHTRILGRRSEATTQKYQALWGRDGFPFNVVHAKLASALQAHYDEDGIQATVLCAMSFGKPSIQDSLAALRKSGCDRIVVVPLYPQSAYTTTGVVTDEVERALKKLKWSVKVDTVADYHDNEDYVHALAASLRHAGFDPGSDDRVFFSFHSIPLRDIEAGDTYELQVGATSLAVVDVLGIDRYRWTIGYQSQFEDGHTWLSPFTAETLASWAESDSDARVFLICPNFAVDCLETTYEIQQEIIPDYLRRKHPNAQEGQSLVTDDDIVYVPCLNASKAHLKVLVSVLEPYLKRSEAQ